MARLSPEERANVDAFLSETGQKLAEGLKRSLTEKNDKKRLEKDGECDGHAQRQVKE